ncbi:MAG: hypothetical protein QNJ35_16185 [Paracoccaceae bacterium]|nr:hypothetical protein [Paracoccaceae bacterium]
MSVQIEDKQIEKTALKSAANDTSKHVPEWAEDMEHTLRRLISERQEKRDRNPWLYR